MGLIIQLQGNSQVSTGVNNGIASDYVGWDNSNLFQLEIRHDGIDFPINFYTNKPTTPSFNTNMRMKIWRELITIPDGSTDYEVGRVGILSSSDGWSTYPRPVSLLHLGTGIDGNGNTGYRKWMDIGYGSFTLAKLI